MDLRIARLVDHQEGVVARRQLLAVGLVPHEVRRLLRRRDLAPVHAGIYVTHTGIPSWREQAWAAVLATSRFDETGRPSGSALSHSSALHVERRTEAKAGDPFHICIDETRTVAAPRGVLLHRRSNLAGQLHPVGRPPRIAFDQSVIDVASQSSRLGAVGTLAQAVNERRTTADRLLKVVHGRRRVRHRAWICAVLTDIAEGTHSVLEHGFVTQVLRPHSLPVAQRQAREVTAIGLAYRDARYRGRIVELDGRAHHASPEQHAADLDRDLFAAVAGRQTLRLGWQQVFNTPCRTAAVLSHTLDQPAQTCSARCGLPEAKRRIRATM